MFSRPLLPLQCVTPAAQGVIAETKCNLAEAWPWLAQGNVGYSTLQLSDDVVRQLKALGYGVELDPRWRRATLRFGRTACVTEALHIRHEVYIAYQKMKSAFWFKGLTVSSSCEQLDMLLLEDVRPATMTAGERRSRMESLLDPLGIGTRVFKFQSPLFGPRKRWLSRVVLRAETLGLDASSVIEERCAVMDPNELRYLGE